MHSNEGSGHLAHAGHAGQGSCLGQDEDEGHAGQTGGTIWDFNIYKSSSRCGGLCGYIIVAVLPDCSEYELDPVAVESYPL